MQSEQGHQTSHMTYDIHLSVQIHSVHGLSRGVWFLKSTQVDRFSQVKADRVAEAHRHLHWMKEKRLEPSELQ